MTRHLMSARDGAGRLRGDCARLIAGADNSSARFTIWRGFAYEL